MIRRRHTKAGKAEKSRKEFRRSVLKKHELEKNACISGHFIIE